MRAKKGLLIILFGALIWVLAAVGAVSIVRADEIRPEITNYPHPIICKPIIVKDGVTHIADKKDWVILTWAQLEKLDKEKLTFTTRNGKFTFPAKGYICLM